MQVQAVSFKSYNSILKSAWKKGKLPTVTKGIYGNILTLENLSLEHIIPHSQGGKTLLNNLLLADARENSKRGIKPIMDVISYEQLFDYLNQFVGVRYEKFKGNDYIAQIIKTIGRIK